MEPFIGQIELFPYSYAPMGWMPCDGSTLEISQWSVLYSLLGTRFGGDGITTFCIPNLTNAVPVMGTSYYIAVKGTYPVRG